MPLILKRPSHQVAILIPLSNCPSLTPAEELSLKHLMTYLCDYDKYFIVPEGLKIERPGIENQYFGHKYFGSAEAHSQLLLSPAFYETFSDYEYVMIYHLDALCFSDQLGYWCDQGYDYIAPPWIKHEDAPYAGMEEFEGKIGNGGFSLRKVKSFLKVLKSPVHFIDPDVYWQDFCRNRSALSCFINLPRKYLVGTRLFNNVRTEIKKYVTIEDSFWANRAKYYYKDFNSAPIDVALKFAFECVPRYCYKLNNEVLPFGCHAWERYDNEFWKPYVLKDN